MATDPLNGFASKAEITANYQYNENAFLLGKIHKKHGVNFQASFDDDRHVFIVSGSRSGKGTSLIIPNLITWRGGVFCIDPKGENASITAIRRGKEDTARKTKTRTRKLLGQNVLVLDPFGVVKGAAKHYRAAYNPLDDIDITADDAAENIFSLVESLVVSDGGKDSHWDETAETLLAGVIDAVLWHEFNNAPNKNLPFCVDLFQNKDIEELGQYLLDANSQTGLANEAASILAYAGDAEMGSHRTTLSRQIRFMKDPRMRRHLEGGEGVSLVRALRENWTVYVCIPPSNIHRAKRWLRLVTRIAINAKMTNPFERGGKQTLFVLDEFYALGEMKIIEESSAYMAGYGIKLLPIIQNIGQLKTLYPKNWETFMSNAGAIVAWGLNDQETEKYISERMGSVWEETRSRSISRGGSIAATDDSNQNDSISISRQEVAIRWPNQVHAEGVRENMLGYVISGKGKPFMIERENYFDAFQQKEFDDEETINRIEKEEAGKA